MLKMYRNTLSDRSAARAVSIIRATLLILMGSVLLAVSAHVEIPFWPVPLTMQSFVVLMLGLGYSGPLAVSTLLTYLLEGALGLPVFAGGGGLAYMMGPTGGYLVGFFVAVMVLAGLRRRGLIVSLPSVLLAALVADVCVFACGVVWLAAFVGLDKALAVGVIPFMPGDALKVTLATASIGAMRIVFKEN